MATEIIRIDRDDHTWIMNWGTQTDRSASAIIAYWVKKQKLEMGETVVLKDRTKSRAIYCRPYYLPLETIRKIPAGRLPYPFKGNAIEVDAGLLKLPHDKSLLKTLADGITDSDNHMRRIKWIKCTHILTWILQRVGGFMGNEMRMESLPLLNAISDYKIDVWEESIGIFIPVNDTARNILRILTINCDEESESHEMEKEYYSPEDLWMLWGAGYEIHYKDVVL